jgi:hypothetical protein
MDGVPFVVVGINYMTCIQEITPIVPKGESVRSDTGQALAVKHSTLTSRFLERMCVPLGIFRIGDLKSSTFSHALPLV